MLSNFLKNLSILKKFLFINLIFFTIIGLFTFIYLKNVQPNLIKKKSIIINTSRGDCIDEEALVNGLESGIIGGLGMDVFPLEPYYGKLTSYDNVVLTPHIATLTEESRLAMEIEAIPLVGSILRCQDAMLVGDDTTLMKELWFMQAIVEQITDAFQAISPSVLAYV